MNEPQPNFTATIMVTRGRTQEPHKGAFVFGDDGHRRVPMEMDGVDGLNTVGIWIDGPAVFSSGTSFTGRCRVLCENAFRDRISEGTKFKLWDGGFFAEGSVQNIHWKNWTEETEPEDGQVFSEGAPSEKLSS